MRCLIWPMDISTRRHAARRSKVCMPHHHQDKKGYPGQRSGGYLSTSSWLTGAACACCAVHARRRDADTARQHALLADELVHLEMEIEGVTRALRAAGKVRAGHQHPRMGCL